MNASQLVKLFLQEDSAAVGLVDSWIRAAALPFRGRLAGDWEDILQEIHLEVFQQLRGGAFQGQARLKTYVWSTAIHTCIDSLRKQATWKFTTLESLQTGLTGATPLDEIQRSSKNRHLLQVLQKTSHDCRELWRLVLDGLNYRQIGARLKINEGTVRVRVHRCRKNAIALRHKLEA